MTASAAEARELAGVARATKRAHQHERERLVARTGRKRAATSRPFSVSGMSVTPVCCPLRLHSVSPCRIRMTRCPDIDLPPPSTSREACMDRSARRPSALLFGSLKNVHAAGYERPKQSGKESTDGASTSTRDEADGAWRRPWWQDHAPQRRGAQEDRRVLARGELSLRRADLPLRQSAAQAAADEGAHQAAPARTLGHDARAQFHLRAPESRHQEVRSRRRST